MLNNLDECFAQIEHGIDLFVPVGLDFLALGRAEPQALGGVFIQIFLLGGPAEHGLNHPPIAVNCRLSCRVWVRVMSLAFLGQ